MFELYEYKNKYEKPQVTLQPVNPCSEYEAKKCNLGEGKVWLSCFQGHSLSSKKFFFFKNPLFGPPPPPPLPQAVLLSRRTMSKLV